MEAEKKDYRTERGGCETPEPGPTGPSTNRK